ncbi:unnamed protein product [Ixodes hexagonus]
MQQHSPFREVRGKCSRHQLCLQCIRTADLCVGTQRAPFSTSQSQMDTFTRQVFGKEVWEDCQRQRRTDPEVRSRLEVKLLEGEGIFRTQGGTSTCCRLWVEDGGSNVAPAVQRKWMPKSTLGFFVELGEPSSSSLVLELWSWDSYDLRDSLMSLCRSGSFGCLFLSLRSIVANFFQPPRKQLLGRLEKRIQELSLFGAEEWHLLRDSTGTDLTSRVQLSVNIRACMPGDFSVLQSIRDHYALSYAFLEYRVDESAESDVSEWTTWLHCVGKKAFTLLRHHAMQNSIDDVEAHYCHLLALTEHRMRVNTQISFAVMLPLLRELQLQLAEKKHAFVGDALVRLIRGLSDHINVQLANFHKQFYLDYERHVMDLSAALSICVLMELTEDVRAVESARGALQQSAEEWYDSLAESWNADTDIHSVAAVLDKVHDQHTKANEIFLEAWDETYTNIVIHQLDEFFVKNIRPRVERLAADANIALCENDDEVLATSIETFAVISSFLRELIPLAKNNENIEMKKYREWFGIKLVGRWFCQASRESDIILSFVAEDDLRPLNANVKYSMSFAQTAYWIEKYIIDLWLRLDWPVPECTSAFAEGVLKWTLLYATTIQEKVHLESAHHVSTVPARVCVVINNLTAAAAYINDVRSIIIEGFAATSQTFEIFSEVDAKLQEAIEEVNACKSRVQDVAVLAVLPCIERRLGSILHASSTVTQEKELEEMLKEVTACLTTLRGNLEPDAFKVFLRYFWEKLAALLRRMISRLRMWAQLDARSQSTSYLGMSVAIQQLAKTFAMKNCGFSPGDIAGDVAERQRELKQIFQVPDGAGDG